MAVQAEFPEKMGFLFQPAPYKVMYGGRAGLKSWSSARALLLMAASPRSFYWDQNSLRVLCTREIQKSIGESVHYLLKDQIDRLGLWNHYDVRETYIQSSCGSEFIFAGLKSDPRKIKSTEGVDIAWIEEAEKISHASFTTLDPTIRKHGSEIWVCLNPDEENDFMYQSMILHPPEGAVVMRTGWEDNPWLSEEFLRKKDHLYAVNPEAADNIWGGNVRRRSKATIFADKYRVANLGPKTARWEGPYQGMDFGFANDPNVFVRCWVVRDLRFQGAIHSKVLYIEKAVYAYHTPIDSLPQLGKAISGSEKFTTFADNARPETIHYLQNHGMPNVKACTKGKGSIEDGISFLQSFDLIVIDPDQKEMIEEAKFYSYKVDANSGLVLPEIIDAFNHGWDAVRYAIEPIRKSSYQMGFSSQTLAAFGVC